MKLKPGPAVLHMEFTGGGMRAWISVRDFRQGRYLRHAYFRQVAELPARKPSGIFFTSACAPDGTLEPLQFSAEEIRLIDGWQRGFPLVQRPFAVLGETTGLREEAVIALLQRLAEWEC